MATTKKLTCERCSKACATRLQDPLVLVERRDIAGDLIGMFPQLICLKCVDKARREAGVKKPMTKQAIKKADAAKNVLIFGGAYNERK